MVTGISRAVLNIDTEVSLIFVGINFRGKLKITVSMILEFMANDPINTTC